MKVLLLHPEDSLAELGAKDTWDRVIDFARAPEATYQRWNEQSGCPVSSIYGLSAGPSDLEQMKSLISAGLGQLIDSHGLDWWDILSILFTSEFRLLLLVRRVAGEIAAGCELHATRPDRLFTALAQLGGADLIVRPRNPANGRLQHYRRSLASLDSAQLLQIIQDKFDPQHSIRKYLTRRSRRSGTPAVLLPSAYISASRCAVNYAGRVPGQQFLLVWARRTSRLQSLPPNVRAAALDGYFSRMDEAELAALESGWARLKRSLVAARPEFKLADDTGAFARMPSLLRWGISVRDAWLRVFDTENIVGVLSADDCNPYSRIPLLLAAQRNIPNVACHHGALDYRMAFKTPPAGYYVTKSALERDYLQRLCNLPAEATVSAGSPAAVTRNMDGAKTAAVFFTEPYHTWGWRTDEIYRDLWPDLRAAVDRCGLKLVVKLHPFESVPACRRMLNRLFSDDALRDVRIISGPITDELWRSMKFAMTVQSTTGLECAERGVPVFLCSWLRDTWGGYVEQFARFGFGHLLHSAEEIEHIPELLKSCPTAPKAVWDGIDPRILKDLLCGTARPSDSVVAECAASY